MDDTRAPGELRRGASRRRGRGDKGAALVEFAIIAPLVFCLLLGMFTGGISMNRKNSMTNAVREGARFGATLTDSTTWADDARTRALNLAAGDLTSSQICVRLVKAPSTVKRTSTGCSAAMLAKVPSVSDVPAGECAVLVWSNRTSTLEAVFFSRALDLNASSVSRYERECT
jgi:Flp pilus assembly protein TadG